MHYLKFEKTAEIIASYAPHYSADSFNGVSSWKKLLQIMHQHLPSFRPIKIKTANFNLLENVCWYPKVVSLEANDGGTQHAVTVVGGLVFDSNCGRALKLCRQTLDYCCSTDSHTSTYRRVYKGYRFEEEPFKKKKKMVELQQQGLDFFM